MANKSNRDLFSRLQRSPFCGLIFSFIMTMSFSVSAAQDPGIQDDCRTALEQPVEGVAEKTEGFFSRLIARIRLHANTSRTQEVVAT